MIEPRDITVVVQGPYQDDLTPRALESLRRLLPGAQIVLSTWEGTVIPPEVAGWIDTLLFNPDPGPLDADELLAPQVRARVPKALLNFNRQLRSTINGLRAAGRPYALKIRTDMELEHTGFLSAFAQLGAIPGPLQVFERRIVTTNVRAPSRALAFFVQDFCSFGTTPDMLRLWDIPEIPPSPVLAGMPQAERDPILLVPEQYIFVQALRKSLPVPFPHAVELSEEISEFTRRACAGNLISLDAAGFGVHFHKASLEWANDTPRTRFSYTWLMRASYAEFLSWCRLHCGRDFPNLTNPGEHYERDVAEIAIKDMLVAPGGFLDIPRIMACGRSFLQQARGHEAYNVLAILAHAGKFSPELAVLVGRAVLQCGFHEHARTNALEALAKEPGYPPALALLAEIDRA